ncbi:MAG: ATP-binding protein, partial [Thermodesulfobacteriota bacterium]
DGVNKNKFKHIMENKKRGQEKPYELVYTRKDGQPLITIVSPTLMYDKDDNYLGALGVITDITELKKLERQLLQAHKLESIGGLAAGIAHEINTPMQYVGNNTKFLQDAFNDLFQMCGEYEELFEYAGRGLPAGEIARRAAAIRESHDFDYLKEEIPLAVEQSLEGTSRVANIVQSMKRFAHPSLDQKTLTDINEAIESTITVSRNEWKYVADMVTDLDPALPPAPCVAGEFNQVILNIIINAAHAIAEVVGDGKGGKGRISISTRPVKKWVEIRISDTGTGIPAEVAPRIFDPFFTTKEVGRGTGQGLAIAYAVIVEKHKGSISFETEAGRGTTFIIRLPLESEQG